MTQPIPQLRLIIGIELYAVTLTLAYWITFFSSGSVQVRSDDVYLAFQTACSLGAAWLAVTTLLSAVGLIRRKPFGFVFGLLAGSASIYLGLIDVMFNLTQQMYTVGGAEMMIEILINLHTLLLGPLLIIYLWRHRRAMLNWQSDPSHRGNE